MGVWTDTTGATPAQHSTITQTKTFGKKQKSTLFLTFVLSIVTRIRNFCSIYFLLNGTRVDSVSFNIFHLALIVLHVTPAGEHKGGGFFSQVGLENL